MNKYTEYRDSENKPFGMPTVLFKIGAPKDLQFLRKESLLEQGIRDASLPCNVGGSFDTGSPITFSSYEFLRTELHLSPEQFTRKFQTLEGEPMNIWLFPAHCTLRTFTSTRTIFEDDIFIGGIQKKEIALIKELLPTNPEDYSKKTMVWIGRDIISRLHLLFSGPSQSFAAQDSKSKLLFSMLNWQTMEKQALIRRNDTWTPS